MSTSFKSTPKSDRHAYTMIRAPAATSYRVTVPNNTASRQDRDLLPVPGSATRGVATQPLRWPRRSAIPSPNGNSRLSFVENCKQGGNSSTCQTDKKKNACFFSLSLYKTITSYAKIKFLVVFYA